MAHVEVTTLIGRGGDPHVYQPSPRDVARLQEQAAVFYIGHGLEQPLEAVLKGYRGKTFALAEIISGEAEGDHDDHGHEGHDHDHHGHEHDDHGQDHGGPIEWAGAFTLEVGSYTWSFAKVDGDYADPAMKMIALPGSGSDPIESAEKKAAKLFKKGGQPLAPGGQFTGGIVHKLFFDEDSEKTVFKIEVTEAGTYVFFTEHFPYEFEADEHFFKTADGKDVEPIAEEPEGGHGHGHHHDQDEHKGHDHAGHGHDDHDDHAGHGHDDHDDHAGHGHDDHAGHHHGEHDPHIWLDVAQARKAIAIIAEELSEMHPDHAAEFEAGTRPTTSNSPCSTNGLSTKPAPFLRANVS